MNVNYLYPGACVRARARNYNTVLLNWGFNKNLKNVSEHLRRTCAPLGGAPAQIKEASCYRFAWPFGLWGGKKSRLKYDFNFSICMSIHELCFFG